MFKNNKILHKSLLSYGDKWLYASGMNVKNNPKDISRINEEIQDLKVLVKSGVKIIILNHQGDYNDKSSIHTPYLSKILKKKLKTKVYYFKKINSNLIKKIDIKLKPGEIGILGNTRLFSGEQKNSLSLSKFFSKFADQIVIGGFCKIHRKNSSNYGILNFINGYLSNGVLNEVRKIERWEKKGKNRIAIIGGTKKEKIINGIGFLANKYDYILPTGVFLNMIIKSIGLEIGLSKVLNNKILKARLLNFVKTNNFKKKFILPEKVIVCKKKSKKFFYRDIEKVEKDEIICGVKLTKKMRNLFFELQKKRFSFLIAGTPDFKEKGVRHMGEFLKNFLKKNYLNYLVLGGDTARDLSIKKNISSGGGAALEFLSGKKLPILKKLKQI